jgi:hypothetical protein
MKNQCYHANRTAQWDTVTSLLPKPRKQRLIDVTSFRLSKSLILDPFCSNANNFGSVFTSIFDRRIFETKFPTHASFVNFFFNFQFLQLLEPFLRRSKRECSHAITLLVSC